MNAHSLESLPFSKGERVADLSSSLGINVPEVEGDHHKLSQEAYDAGLSIIKSQGLDHYEIGMFYDVSDIKLDESIPHKFSGFNVVGRVPKGSEIGANSVIHSGTDLNDCIIKNNVQAGDDIHLNNCIVGSDFEAGSDIYLKDTEIGSNFTAIHIQKLENTSIGMMFSAEQIDFMSNENVLGPSHNILSLDKVGNNNQFIGEDPLPKALGQGKNNRRVRMTIDDIDLILQSKDLAQTANRLAQTNGFEPVAFVEPKVENKAQLTLEQENKLSEHTRSVMLGSLQSK